MTGFSVAYNIHLFSLWKILSFFSFGGLKLKLLFYIIAFIIGAKTLFYVRELANLCFTLLNVCCIFRLSSLIHLVLGRCYTVCLYISFDLFKKKINIAVDV